MQLVEYRCFTLALQLNLPLLYFSFFFFEKKKYLLEKKNDRKRQIEIFHSLLHFPKEHHMSVQSQDFTWISSVNGKAKALELSSTAFSIPLSGN